MCNKDKMEGAKIVAAGACHHINNVLAVIVGNAEMMGIASDDEAKAKFSEGMSKGIARLNDVMAKFKTISIGDMDDLPIEEGTGILDVASIMGTVQGAVRKEGV